MQDSDTARDGRSSEQDLITVACVKWGDWCAPHGSRYVNNLFRGVAANLSLPHRFVCFTDDPTGLDADIEVRLLPPNLKGFWWERVYPLPKLASLRPLLALPYLLLRGFDRRSGFEADAKHTWQPIDLRGWYNKLYLFKPGVLQGRCVFIDLDTVIVGSIDAALDFDGDLCILRDFHHQNHYGSGLIAFRAEAMAPIWEQFVRLGCPVMRKGDQQFIEQIMPDAEFFQDRLPGEVVSYKVHCRRRGVPSYARIVCFHGMPRPHEVSDPFLMAKFDLNPKESTRLQELAHAE
jgi:hypothetical protein